MINPDNPGPDYTLHWPQQLFVREARKLLPPPAINDRNEWTDEVELLLVDAFVGAKPASDFRAVGGSVTPSDSASGSIAHSLMLFQASLAPSVREQFLRQLIKAAPRLPKWTPPRPYYMARIVAKPAVPTTRDLPAAQAAWVRLVWNLLDTGYLNRAAPKPCVDDPDAGPTAELALNATIRERLAGTRQWWPPTRRRWDDETFFSVVEVVHDLVTRPRRRWYHDFNSCGWHYYGFTIEPAQVLYRWKVNRLFQESGVELELAAEGEDVGRLVHIPADPRRELIEQVRVNVPDDNESRIAQAITLYRGRHATREDKRRACRELADVLESRKKAVLEKHLVKGDESPLFEIANRFGIRHHREDQMYNYDEAFFDWIFWWYLATVELTNRLMARAGGVA